MSNRFTQKAQNSILGCLEIAQDMGHTYIGTEHMLLALASEGDSISSKLLAARGATPKILRLSLENICGVGTRTHLSSSDMSPRLKRIIEASAAEADVSAEITPRRIGTEHILLALINDRDCMATKLLEANKVPIHELRGDISAYIDTAPTRPKQSGKTEAEQAIHGCPTLSLYGKDLSRRASRGELDPIIGRDSETEHLIRILSRRMKNNPCLIGEPGVGKTAVVEGLAQRIHSGSVPENLREKRIVTLDISAMIAGAKYRGEFEERMKNVMTEVSKNPEIILFMDEFHMIVGAGAAEGAVDAANILKPALARCEIQVIGATTVSEYRAHIEKDAALERRFQPVTVNEPSTDEAIKILKGLRGKYEEHHRLTISDEAIEAAVNLSVRYIPDRYLPDKAIDLVDEAASKLRISVLTVPKSLQKLERELSLTLERKEAAICSQSFELAAKHRREELDISQRLEETRRRYEKRKDGKNLTVSAADIADIVTAWTGIPVSRLLEGESERLLSLEENLKKQVIGQDSAIEAVTRAIKRGRMGLKNPNRPIGSFIFLGKTGVGKTELSKALATLMFGSVDSMIRLDMAEYMEKHSVSKLIGSPPGYVGYGEGGQLTEKIRRRPYSVLLLDEIEKAHPDVFNLLLSVLEDGILTDSAGRRVDFRNTVIIMTSNTGTGYHDSHSLGFSSSSESDKKKNYTANLLSELKKQFSPEFINRVDEIIIFDTLTKSNIERIASDMLSELSERGRSLGISLCFDKSLAEYLAEKSYDERFGARSVRREIVRLIEDKISELMLRGLLRSGDTLSVSAENDSPVFLINGENISVPSI
ncbi:MAG: ATP-dependent Clp protease ATP-binding subunit [Clostridia bacterium]|nr:ATP-dependent Clp protease ATP-binding subunit [Clostridia bacterium]